MPTIKPRSDFFKLTVKPRADVPRLQLSHTDVLYLPLSKGICLMCPIQQIADVLSLQLCKEKMPYIFNQG